MTIAALDEPWAVCAPDGHDTESESKVEGDQLTATCVGPAPLNVYLAVASVGCWRYPVQIWGAVWAGVVPMAAPFAGGAVVVVVVVGASTGEVVTPRLPPYVVGASFWDEVVCVRALTGWMREGVVVVLVVLVDVEVGGSPVACRVRPASA